MKIWFLVAAACFLLPRDSLAVSICFCQFRSLPPDSSSGAPSGTDGLDHSVEQGVPPAEVPPPGFEWARLPDGEWGLMQKGMPAFTGDLTVADQSVSAAPDSEKDEAIYILAGVSDSVTSLRSGECHFTGNLEVSLISTGEVTLSGPVSGELQFSEALDSWRFYSSIPYLQLPTISGNGSNPPDREAMIGLLRQSTDSVWSLRTPEFFAWFLSTEGSTTLLNIDAPEKQWDPKERGHYLVFDPRSSGLLLPHDALELATGSDSLGADSDWIGTPRELTKDYTNGCLALISLRDSEAGKELRYPLMKLTTTRSSPYLPLSVESCSFPGVEEGPFKSENSFRSTAVWDEVSGVHVPRTIEMVRVTPQSDQNWRLQINYSWSRVNDAFTDSDFGLDTMIVAIPDGAPVVDNRLESSSILGSVNGGQLTNSRSQSVTGGGVSQLIVVFSCLTVIPLLIWLGFGRLRSEPR